MARYENVQTKDKQIVLQTSPVKDLHKNSTVVDDRIESPCRRLWNEIGAEVFDADAAVAYARFQALCFHVTPFTSRAAAVLSESAKRYICAIALRICPPAPSFAWFAESEARPRHSAFEFSGSCRCVFSCLARSIFCNSTQILS
jgi:hypothetical protein